MQPQIKRVEDASRARRSPERFQVTGMIPHQRSHAVAALHSQSLQRGRELPGALIHFPVTRARDTEIRSAGNNFDLGEKSSSPLQNGGER